MNKTVLLNYKQHKLLRSRAKYKTWVGGRGSGKTTVVAMLIALLYNLFPKAICVIAGKTYAQIDSTVLAALTELKDIMGLTEWSEDNPSGDYIIGRCPPPDFDRPYKMPGRKIWENCVFFRNGFILRIVSQTRKDTHRGLSVDFIIIEEAAIVNYPDFIETVLLPGLRSPVYAPYYDHPWRGGVVAITSAPETAEGNWVFDHEKDYLEELKTRKEEIKGLTPEQKKAWKKANPPVNLFLESTSDDNLYFLGDDYTDNLRKKMDPWKFNVEVMNQRMTTLPDAYYYAFSEVNETKQDHYSAVHPMSGTLDFNSDITWTLVFQETDNEERLIDTVFKKPSEKKTDQQFGLVTAMAKEFCSRYQDHGNKTFYLYGDPNGNSTNADTNLDNKPFFDKFVAVLKENKWNVIRRELTSYPPRKLRYNLLNMFCGGTHEAIPPFRVNVKCIDFLIALRATRVKVDKTFKKNKDSEKTARRREHATDPTDALDYYVWAKYNHIVMKKKRKDSGLAFG
ncbi:MAG: hypothetical protein Q8K92_19980 [Leadbetterella sp.]|nr:hypothetical protein [Leadbetterella sp.]